MNNDIWYDKQDIVVKEYANNNISIYTNNTPIIGDNIYNAPKEIEGETIQLLIIDNIISNELVYYADRLVRNSYNSNNYWTLTNHPVAECHR